MRRLLSSASLSAAWRVPVVPPRLDGKRICGQVLLRGARSGHLIIPRAPAYMPTGERVGVLYCEERGCCSGELGKGWVAYECDDPDGVDVPGILDYCPPCACAEFGHRPDIAANYVCAWEALPRETADGV